MDHLIGQRFNLISKSEIRYLGTLHEINPEDSTIALEDVYSFGTEDRKVDSFIPPSQQRFDYIVFRGGDVKDIKIAEDQRENEPPSPQNIPNDPAILNSSRAGPPPQGPPRDQSPFHPGFHGPPPHFNGYYPPPPPHYGRGFGPPPGGFAPGPGPGFPGYGPPPPNFYGPPGHGFPQGQPQFQPPPPLSTPQQRQVPPANSSQPATSIDSTPVPKPTSELPVEPKAPANLPSKTATAAQSNVIKSERSSGQVPPISTAPISFAAAAAAAAPKPIPTGPKNTRTIPVVPMTVNQRSFVPPVATDGPLSTNTNALPKPSVPTQEAMEAASRQAKEAVAAAMAKLNPQAATSASKQNTTTAAVEALTRKVSEMRTSDNSPRSRGSFRGRGMYNRSGSGGQPSRKIEIPTSDYDFETANAKFNKEDMIKEAIATGSPIAETPETPISLNGTTETTEPVTNGVSRKDSMPISASQAYDKKSSFFDNISSDSKDREEGNAQRGGRAVRGEEYNKNMDTFGQGTVDTGYRGRGRGYGRGRGRGFGGGDGYRGYNRGYGGGRGNFDSPSRGRGRGRGGTEAAASVANAATAGP